MTFPVRPELPTASVGSSQAPPAAVDNSAPSAIRPESTYKSGKVVQTNGATSVSGLDEPTRKQVRVEPSAVARSIALTAKSSKTVLVVKFTDGTTIYESKAAETFAKAIKKLGVQRVIELGMKVNSFPLVSKQRSDSYAQTPLDSYLVMIHSSTEAKREQLLKIASALKEKLHVDIVAA